MADIEQNAVEITNIVKALEQKFATGIAITGVAPELATNPFGPHVTIDDTLNDGITRYKEIGNPANDEADKGGLFVLGHDQPAVLEWVMMDLSSIEDWTVSIVTSAGEWQVDAGNGRYVIINPKAPIMPGESVKITSTTTTTKAWMRIYVRSDQARR
jgi:hypothetical protein